MSLLPLFIFGWCLQMTLPFTVLQCSSSGNCMAPELEKSLSTGLTTYSSQGLVHCNPFNRDSVDECKALFSPKDNMYSLPLRDHYIAVGKQLNHSVNTINRNVKWEKRARPPSVFTVDLVIDARCHHSWPFNPYHRIADCLLFILPSLYDYFLIYRQSASNRKILVLVDESSELLCDARNNATNFEGRKIKPKSDDICLLSTLQQLIRNKNLNYQCIRTSNFFASSRFFRAYQYTSVVAKEVIWLKEQMNPETFGSGYQNNKHPHYDQFLGAYRRFYFGAYCEHCRLSLSSPMLGVLSQSRKTGFGEALPQNIVLLILRNSKSGRHMLQRQLLVDSITSAVANIGSSEVNASSLTKKYYVMSYSGGESMCETISRFWSAKVIIAAHGAGIVNTVFARPGTLLVEITPDRLEPELRGQPWRTNTPFARSAGLSTHVIVIPHNESAKTDADIQRKYPMSLERKHIDKVVEVMDSFLRQGIAPSESVTSMV